MNYIDLTYLAKYDKMPRVSAGRKTTQGALPRVVFLRGFRKEVAPMYLLHRKGGEKLGNGEKIRC
jgi:hypothetical protein